MKVYKNLAYEGGGVLGSAYCGVDLILESRGILETVEKVAGVSAGGIFALLQALKYTAREKFAIFSDMDFASFQDGDIFDKVKVLKMYGIHPGNVFFDWCKDVISKKGISATATFKDFKNAGFLDLHVFAVSLDRGLVRFSNETTPDVPVCDAVRATMSIPGFFQAHSINGEIFVDGGVQHNYPITFCDQNGVANFETLGFNLGTLGIKRHLDPLEYGEVKHFLLRLFEQERNQQMIDLMNEPDNIKRTVFIPDLGISPVNFHLTIDDKINLFKSGFDAAQQYFD